MPHRTTVPRPTTSCGSARRRRVRQIRAAAEYDAAAALIQLQDWTAAAAVLEAFRSNWPDHELNREVTRQIAFVYRQNGQLSRAAGEYERVASESGDPNLQGEALLVAGNLYEQSGATAQALAAYARYVEQFPRPIDTAIETRFKIAGFHQASHDDALYLAELEQIVRVDAEAGAERTGRTRTLAARSALVLSERLYREFAAFELRQPFEASIVEKKRLMDGSVEAFERLIDYEIGEVTAAATYYLAEIHFGFSRSLMASERPPGDGGRGARGLRARDRGRGLSVRGTGDRDPREEHGAGAGRDPQRLDRQEPRQARRARAGALRQGRAVERLSRLDRALRIHHSGRAAIGVGGAAVRGAAADDASRRRGWKTGR